MIRIKNESFWKLQGNMTEEAFSRKLGISRTQLWRVRTGKSSVGSDFIERFLRNFPDLNFSDYFFASGVALPPQLSSSETLAANPTAKEARTQSKDGDETAGT